MFFMIMLPQGLQNNLSTGVGSQTLSDMLVLRSLLSADSATSVYPDLQSHLSGVSDWNGHPGLPRPSRNQDSAAPATHDFHCSVSHTHEL